MSSTQAAHFVGFDPGGKSAFGWAVLAKVGADLELVATGTCAGARAALAAAAIASPTIPVAFGTDSPLYWVEAGDRKADAVVRKMVCAAGGSSGTVSHVNSLRGACLVQGILVIRFAAELWPMASITETHPKALLKVSKSAREFAERIAKRVITEHERDAALAAFAAFSMVEYSEGWTDLAETDVRPFFPGGKRLAYWFPKART
jgi:hypothetical protein